jgi:hypothetical protein
MSLSCQPNQDQKLRQHVIYTKNGFLPTAEILQEFDNDHCTNLAEKPKMFFINVRKNEDVLQFCWSSPLDVYLFVMLSYYFSPESSSI